MTKKRSSFEFNFKESATTASKLPLLHAYRGPSLLSRIQVNCGITAKKKAVNDDARPGRTNTSATAENIEAVKIMVLNNQRITIKEVADNVDISFGSCQAIFRDVLQRRLFQGQSRFALKCHNW